MNRIYCAGCDGPARVKQSFRENCGTSELAQKLMLIAYAMTLASKMEIGDQRQIIPSIHRQAPGFKGVGSVDLFLRSRRVLSAHFVSISSAVGGR